MKSHNQRVTKQKMEWGLLDFQTYIHLNTQMCLKILFYLVHARAFAKLFAYLVSFNIPRNLMKSHPSFSDDETTFFYTPPYDLDILCSKRHCFVEESGLTLKNGLDGPGAAGTRQCSTRLTTTWLPTAEPRDPSLSLHFHSPQWFWLRHGLLPTSSTLFNRGSWNCGNDLKIYNECERNNVVTRELITEDNGKGKK